MAALGAGFAVGACRRSPVMVLGWLALAAVVAVSLARKQRIGPVWLAALGYAVACQVPIYLMRSSQFTALELAQTLRYLPDLVVVLALLAAVGFCAPNRGGSGWLDASPRPHRGDGRRAALAFLASSLYSTATFLTSWQDNPTQPYLQNARARPGGRRGRRRRAPLLDQEVDPLMLQRVAWPENLASHMFALIRDRPEFARYTTELRMLDSSGTAGRRQGDVGADHRAGPEAAVRLLRPARRRRCGCRWTGRCCPRSGPPRSTTWPTATARCRCRCPDGPETKVAVHPGLNRVFVRLSGAGDAITVRARHHRAVGVRGVGPGRLSGAAQ